MQQQDDTYQRRRLSVLGRIRRNPGIDGTRLCKRAQAIPQLDRERILADLEQSGEIRIEQVPTNGRTKLRFFPTAAVTQPEAPESATLVIRPPGRTNPPPGEEERVALLQMISNSEPVRLDWDALKAVVDTAYA